MTGIIHHRGPDGSGFYRDPFASLGDRRLSIIDVAAGGRPVLARAGEFSIRGQIHLANQPVGHGDLSGCSLYSQGPFDIVEGHLLDIPRPAKHRRDLLQLVLIFILREWKYPVGLPEG